MIHNPIHSKMNYYNEFDAKTAAWLKQLITEGLVPNGDVDTRSITEVTKGDLSGYTQCHFFAGIGGWSLALQLAGWPRDRPVWTGSCPCQPFSTAGKQKGNEDERHLWPVFFNLIRQCRPVTVFGEQVANAIGKGWLDGISADLESENYACGATVLGAHSVGAPHIRQRLYWVAYSDSGQREELRDARDMQSEQSIQPASCDSASSGVADSIGAGIGRGNQRGSGEGGQQVEEQENGKNPTNQSSNRGEDALRLAQPSDNGAGGDSGEASRCERQSVDAWTEGLRQAYGEAGSSGADSRSSSSADRVADSDNIDGQQLRGHTRDETKQPIERLENPWSDHTLLPCRDGKTRRIPTEPAFFPLANGVPARVVRLRGYGNAIVPQVAAAFIQAFLDTNESAQPIL